MTLRLLFDERQANKDLVQEENLPRNVSSAGWSMDTWFQKRLRYVREQQKKKVAESDIVYKCALGVVTLRLSNDRK